jgi:hypothetical protein
MLDFKGRTPGDEATKEQMQAFLDQALTTPGVHSAIVSRGALLQTVLAWCENVGLKVTDSGIGGDRWHVGIPFDDPLHALSAMLQARCQFHQAIKRGWVSLALMTWGSDGEWNDPWGDHTDSTYLDPCKDGPCGAPTA